jgi:hypothetical protein
MVRSLAILAMSLWACTAGQAQSANDEFRLRATVQAVIPLASFSGATTAVDVDPKFMCQPSHLCAQTTVPANGVQAKETAPNSVGVPKPAVDLTAGTWKYKATTVQPDGTYLDTYSITIKDDGGVWTVTTTWKTPGPVTDVQTLEKGTLILRKELFKHFAKPGRPWKRTTNLDFTGNKVTGTTNISGQDKPVAIDLGGPLFAGAEGSAVTIGCLPLADGYSATFRNFDIQSQEETLVHVKVVGLERVTVPAGTFDSYKVELTSANGRSSYKGIVWIAKDSRTPVKGTGSETVGRGTMFTTTELVP